MISTFAFARRNLGRHRVRAVLGGLGIFSAIALLTAIQTGLDSLSLSYLQLLELQTGKADVLLSRNGAEWFNSDSFEPQDLPSALTNSSELTDFSGRVQGLAVVQHDRSEHHAVLVGVDFAKESALGFPSVRPEDTRLTGKQCLISGSLAKRLEVKAGAKIWVRGANNYSDQELHVAGINERQFLLPQQLKDYILVEFATAQNITGDIGRVHYMAAAFKNRSGVYDARNLHESVLRLKKLGSEMAAKSGSRYQIRMPKASAIAAFQEITAPLRAFFGIFALLTLVITGLLIHSLIAVAVEERIREYGLLRTLGGRKELIFRLVITESMLLCLLGAIPGVVAGVMLAKMLVVMVGAIIGGGAGSIPLDVRWPSLVVALAAGVLLALLSAFAPAMNATRWKIVDALDPLRKGQVPEEPAQTNSDRPLILSGLTISGLAGIIFFVLPSALFSGNPSVIGSIVLCLLLALLLGLTMAGMGALPWARLAILLLLGWAFRPVTELVWRNLERHRRRHLTTALLFTLSVSLVLFIASLVALFSRSAIVWVDHSIGADLRIHSPLPEGQSSKPDLQGVQGVKSVSATRFLHHRSSEGIAYDVVVGDLVGMKQLWVVPFGADADLADTINRSLVRYHSGPVNALEQLCAYTQQPDTANDLPPVILSLAVARYLEVSPGDPVELSFRLGSRRKDGRCRVLAVCESLPGFKNFRGRVALAVGSGVLLPESAFTNFTASAPEPAFQTAYFVKTGGDAAVQKDVARMIRDKFDLRFRFGVESAAEQKEGARAMYWATQVFFGLLLAGAVIIAVFALIASMTVTVLERQREIGVMRALGLRRVHMFRLLFGEASVLTLSAGVLGGLIGFTLAGLFVMQTAALLELPVSFTMPYLTFIATVAVSLLSGLVAAFVPARHLLKKTVSEILRG